MGRAGRPGRPEDRRLRHTVGLSLHVEDGERCPELWPAGLDAAVAASMLDGLAGPVRSGALEPADGVRLDPTDPRSGASVPLRVVGPFDAEAAEASTAVRLCGADRVLQVLWPDDAGRFPDEQGYDHRRSPQRLLTRR